MRHRVAFPGEANPAQQSRRVGGCGVTKTCRVGEFGTAQTQTICHLQAAIRSTGSTRMAGVLTQFGMGLNPRWIPMVRRNRGRLHIKQPPASRLASTPQTLPKGPRPREPIRSRQLMKAAATWSAPSRALPRRMKGIRVMTLPAAHSLTHQTQMPVWRWGLSVFWPPAEVFKAWFIRPL